MVVAVSEPSYGVCMASMLEITIVVLGRYLLFRLLDP